MQKSAILTKFEFESNLQNADFPLKIVHLIKNLIESNNSKNPVKEQKFGKKRRMNNKI